MNSVVAAVNAGLNAVFIGLIRAYQYTLSPMLGQRCKYYPSCSNYAIGALREHGAIKGLGLASGDCCAATRSATAATIPCPPGIRTGGTTPPYGCERTCITSRSSRS